MEHLEFEKPIATLEKKLIDLRELSENGVDLQSEIEAIEKKLTTLTQEIYKNLTPWQKVQLSRHPNRPYSMDYIENLFPDFMELLGDRKFGNDKSIIGGIATIELNQEKIPLLVIGQQKGRSTKQKMEQNFGMAKPEGYRKAMRLMELAERFRLPILTLIDTPGAYPGVDAEERGQAQAIAESILLMFTLTVPVISVVIGEGGSGGALAIGVANRVLMQENSTYSVISPESCASILWSESKYAERASEVLKMNPKDLEKLKVIDGIIPEPIGGAHRDWTLTFQNVKKSIEQNFLELLKNSENQKNIANSNGLSAVAHGTKKLKTKKLKESKSTPKITFGVAHKILSNKLICHYFKKERVLKFRKMGDSALAKTAHNGKTK